MIDVEAIRRRLHRNYSATPRRMSDAFKSARADVRALLSDYTRQARIRSASNHLRRALDIPADPLDAFGDVDG